MLPPGLRAYSQYREGNKETSKQVKKIYQRNHGQNETHLEPVLHI